VGTILGWHLKVGPADTGSLYLDDSVEFAIFVMFRVLAEKNVVLYFL
jgi:hypothetical protein